MREVVDANLGKPVFLFAVIFVKAERCCFSTQVSSKNVGYQMSYLTVE